MMFTAEVRKNLTQKLSIKQFSAVASQKWEKMSEEQKDQFRKYADHENNTVYKEELARYKRIHPEFDEHKRYNLKKKKEPKEKLEVSGDLSEEA